MIAMKKNKSKIIVFTVFILTVIMGFAFFQDQVSLRLKTSFSNFNYGNMIFITIGIIFIGILLYLGSKMIYKKDEIEDLINNGGKENE